MVIILFAVDKWKSSKLCAKGKKKDDRKPILPKSSMNSARGPYHKVSSSASVNNNATNTLETIIGVDKNLVEFNKPFGSFNANKAGMPLKKKTRFADEIIIEN